MSPPRLSRALLARILPEDMRDPTLADLEEMYSRRVERGGVPGARRWYRLQVVSFALRFGWERIRAAGARAPAPLFSTLDWKLGFRMLVKHPGLSLIGGLALATVIGFGAGFAHVGRQVLLPDLGFEDGDRIVRLDRYDLAQRVSGPVTVEELRIWREELTMIEQLGAYRPMERTLVGAVGEDGVTTRAPLVAAKITASAFRLTGVEAFRGRVLSEADERPGAPPVVVLGHDVWQDRFDGQPEVLGRELQLGRERYTVVGVMPEGFGFPESHDAWVPLRLDELGPSDQRVVRAFGKLAPGATLAAAQAELTAIGGRTTAELDRRNGLPVTASTGDSVVALLQPRVLGFAAPDPAGDDLMGALLTSFLILTCLGAVAANVATLVFARTALREAELVVRGALGASRGHIAGQLFVEALVLAGVAAVVGVLGAQAVVEYVMNMPLTRQQGRMPFWWTATFDWGTVLVGAGLAVLAAALVALLPALKATGKDVGDALKSVGAGAANLRFGGVWSVIIVLQVAVTVVSLPFGVEYARDVWRSAEARRAFPAEGYLTFELVIDSDSVEPGAADGHPYLIQLARVYEELDRRLRREPGVEDVTFGSTFPGMPFGLGDLEVESAQGAADRGATYRTWSRNARVDVRYFDVFALPVVAGRGFGPSDVDAPNLPVLVNEAFARNIGERAVGTRLRAPPTTLNRSRGLALEGEPGAWMEIVGVVRDLGTNASNRDPLHGLEPEDRIVFHPASASQALPLRVAVKTADPSALAPRLRAVAADVDPAIRLYDLLPLDQAIRQRYHPEVLAALSGVGGILLCILLSAAGLFALMAVGVARRTREMGIRLALGASRGGLLQSLFGRAAKQLASGVGIGSALYVGMTAAFDNLTGYVIWPVATVSAVMLMVGLGACAVPARRALRIKPVEALRE